MKVARHTTRQAFYGGQPMTARNVVTAVPAIWAIAVGNAGLLAWVLA